MFPAIDAVNQPLFPLDSPSAYTEQGYLQARVFAAREALPIAGATVTVSQRRDGGERLLAAGVTDESGLSPPCPPRPGPIRKARGSTTPMPSMWCASAPRAMSPPRTTRRWSSRA